MGDPAVEKLRSERETSTIPSANGEPWQYPSEKQFYKAATLKGHDVPTEDMPAVISVHNVVNEQAWRQILPYENLHADSCSTPKLIRFIGRPDDRSPKSYAMGVIKGWSSPFDRHDWFVDR